MYFRKEFPTSHTFCISKIYGKQRYIISEKAVKTANVSA